MKQTIEMSCRANLRSSMIFEGHAPLLQTTHETAGGLIYDFYRVAATAIAPMEIRFVPILFITTTYATT
jgi:hypothetical protein